MELSREMIIKMALSLIFVGGAILLRWGVGRIINRHARNTNIAESRKFYVVKLFNVFLFIFIFALLSILWDISYKGLAIYFTSFFAVAGIGLFASWSILSNVTAAVILFFYFPYRIGSKIKIIDGENSVSGIIADITLFYIRVQTDEGKTISYPNNLALQKPVQILDEGFDNHLSGKK